jgi:hypothetical protein
MSVSNVSYVNKGYAQDLQTAENLGNRYNAAQKNLSAAIEKGDEKDIATAQMEYQKAERAMGVFQAMLQSGKKLIDQIIAAISGR